MTEAAMMLVQPAGDGIDEQTSLRDGQAAVLFATADFDSAQSQLMGRHVANAAFVQALARHGQVERHFGVCARAGDFAQFTQAVESAGGPPRPCVRVTATDHRGLAEAGLLYVPTCTLGPPAWLRRQGDQRGYSLCGITHAVACDRVTEGLADLAVAPLQPWDALICTSRAVRATVQSLTEQWGEYLRERLGAAQTEPALQLPVIPLGVDSAAFGDRTVAAAARARWRRELAIADEDCVFLFSGRLSYHAKANPTPMYQALEAAAAGRGRVHLVHYGWFPNPAIQTAFEEAARTLCPSVRSVFVDGRGPAGGPHSGIYHAADVFTSLSDNIQESFGLTPLEAMAAGLPLVVTDWDGYRDTIRDGVDGFTIPTLTPGPLMGENLARFYEAGTLSYDSYIGNASLATSVDTAACARAYRALIDDPGLRRRLGEAAQQRARRDYDWKHIIARYQELWRELATMRRDATVLERAPRRPGRPYNPRRPEPFGHFRSFATRQIQPDDVVASAVADLPAAYQRLSGLALNSYGFAAVGLERARRALVDMVVEAQPCPVAALVDGTPAPARAQAIRTLAWLAKLGLVSLGDHNR
jgi:starch synthase